MLTPNTPKQHPLKTPTRTRHKPGGQLPSNGGHLVMPATPRPTKTPMRSRRRSLAPTSTTNRLHNSNNNHNNSIVDYCTPTTTRAGNTPNGRSKIRGVFRYRPLELDNESSTESTMNCNYLSQDKEQLPSPQESRAKRLKREEPTPLSIKGSQCITPPITPDKPVEAEVVVEIIETEDKFKVKVKDTNSVATKVQDQPAVALTARVLTQEPPKLLQKLPSFIPGNCNIEELLKMYGTKTSNTTNRTTAITTDNDINNTSSTTANNNNINKGNGSSTTKTLIPLIELD